MIFHIKKNIILYMDLNSTMYVTSTMTSPVTKTAKTSKWLRLMYSMHVHRTCILKTEINRLTKKKWMHIAHARA